MNPRLARLNAMTSPIIIEHVARDMQCRLDACNAQMRGDTNCKFPPGHRGRHSSVAWQCDACGRWSRSQGKYYEQIGKVCFFCGTLPGIKRDWYGY